MSKSSQDKFGLRYAVVHHAKAHGIRDATRRFQCSRNTVRLWLRRYDSGDRSLVDRSKRPLHSPRRTPAHVEKPSLKRAKRPPASAPRVSWTPLI